MAPNWVERLSAWWERTQHSLKSKWWLWPVGFGLDLVWHSIYTRTNEFLAEHAPTAVARVVALIPSGPAGLAIIIGVLIIVSLAAHAYFDTRPTPVTTRTKVITAVSCVLVVAIFTVWLITRPIAIYPTFMSAYEQYQKRIGKPLFSAREGGTSAYEAQHQRALVVWLQGEGHWYFFPRNTKEWLSEKEAFWPREDEPAFRPPPGLGPPRGGLAYLWREDPRKWERIIGWKGWECGFFGTNIPHYQGFENGEMIGPLLIGGKNTRESQVLVLFKDDHSWEPVPIRGTTQECYDYPSSSN